MFSETSESPETTIVQVAFLKASASISSRAKWWGFIAYVRERSVWIHAHIECKGNALLCGPIRSIVVPITTIDRCRLVTERVDVRVDRLEDVLNGMAGAVTWVRVSFWSAALYWLTFGRLGADCVSVTKHILQSAGVPVPDKIRRVKELREWLIATSKQ